jgi:nitronate monooxygenase
MSTRLVCALAWSQMQKDAAVIRHRSTRATRCLGISHPIVQGPFGGSLSTVELVSTVSNAGGLGSYGAHVIAPDRIGALRAEIARHTSSPFALNLWVKDHDPGAADFSRAQFERLSEQFAPYFRELGLAPPTPPDHYHESYEEQVEALLEARPPVFSFVFGVPSKKVLLACKERAIVTIGAATSSAEAVCLEQAGVDLIVATGMEAGGHRPSFLAPAEDSLVGTFALTQLISARVRCPVIAAGGIADRRGIQAALTLGAEAAQIGTAFLACRESGTTDAHRRLLFSPAAERTTLTRAFSGRLARGLINRWTEETNLQASNVAPFPVQSWFVSQLRSAAVSAERTDLVSLWAGQIAPILRHHTASDLMNALLEEPST